jgi:hypothetical protein
MTSNNEDIDELYEKKIWIPNVIITQTPFVSSNSNKICPDTLKIPEINSWAKKFTKDKDVYGVEFSADSIHFFVPKLTFYDRAAETGDIILQSLIQRFPGLDGFSKPLMNPPLPSKYDKVWEFQALNERIRPETVYKTTDKINIVQNFLLSTVKEGINLKLIILFEKGRSSYKTDLNDIEFKLKVYFRIECPPFKSEYEECVHRGIYDSVLDALSNSQQVWGKDGKLLRVYLKIFTIYDINEEWAKIWTSFKFSEKNKPTFVMTPKKFNFSFPDGIKNLNNSFYFPNENQMILSKYLKENDYLKLGHILNHSAVTRNFGICPIDLLRRNMGIFGITGTGKTYLNLQIISELNKKRPKTGALILSLAKKNQDILYRDLVDVVCIYGENEFSIPYLVYNEDIDPNSENFPPSSTMPLQATAQLLMACLDLKDPYVNVASQILRESYENHSIPENLGELFDKIPESVEKYGPELNKNMTGIFNNRKGILQDDLLLETTKFLNGKVPDWFDWWLQGKSVFLDLSTCANNYVKSLLVFLILNMIYIRAKELPIGVDELKNIVFIDEAHHVFSKPRNNSDSANEEMKSEILGKFLTEIRSKGISMVISDQQPTALLDVTNQSIGTRINFNLNENATNFFYNNPIEREIIKQLSKRRAHVKYENKSFFIETIDLNLNEFHKRQENKKNEEKEEYEENFVKNPSINWYISQILRNLIYVNKNIASKKITTSLYSYFHRLIAKKKFLHAHFIAYGLWNNIYHYYLSKLQENGIEIDIKYYTKKLTSTIDEINPVFRTILHDVQWNQKLNNYDLKEKDVRLFYNALMEYTKEIQDIYNENMEFRANSPNKKEVNEHA